MNSTLNNAETTVFNQAVVAAYRSYADAETAVRRLATGGLPLDTISIVGRNFEPHEELQASEFLVVVHGAADEAARAPAILEAATGTHLLTQSVMPDGSITANVR